MTGSQKIMVIGGLSLAIFGMIYGLWYAIFDEHQTLEHMGLSLAQSFSHAAERNMVEARAALAEYGAVAADYEREVHAHTHWITLGFIWIILGLAFNRVGLAENLRQFIAVALIVGSFIFPAGVLMETVHRGALAGGMAVIGSVAVLLGMVAVTFGLFRERSASG